MMKSIPHNLALATICLLCLVAPTRAQAQQELGLHFLNNVWTANSTNPAFVPEKRWSVQLPSVFFNFNSPDYALKDLTIQEGGKTKLNLTTAIDRLKPDNFVYGNLNVQTLGVSVPISSKWTLMLNHEAKADMTFNFTKDLVNGFYKGNREYLGKTLNMGSDFDINLYSQLSLGAAYKINDMVTVGAKVKSFSGIAGIFTEKKKVDVFTDTTAYKLQFTTDYDMRTYGYDDLSKIVKDNTYASFATSKFFSGNTGLGFDLGANVRLGKLQLSASIIDLGASMTYKENARGYASSGVYTYQGFNGSKFFNLDSVQTTKWSDTLKAIVNLRESNTVETKVTVPMKIYLSAQYKLTEKLRVGGLFYNESRDNKTTNTAFALSANYAPFKALSFGATYASRNGTFDQLGANLVLNVWVFQLYAVTDNVLALANTIESKSANGRIGLNLVF